MNTGSCIDRDDAMESKFAQPHAARRGRKDMSEAPLLAMGEVHTALLQSSQAVPLNLAAGLVGQPGGEQVRVYHRPIAHAGSPDVLTGIDCRLPTRTGTKSRGVGTVAARVSITGGHLLQSTARIRISTGPQNRRLGWSHYLTRPGHVELVGKGDAQDLADGFTAEERDPQTLDLGSVAARLLNAVQRSDRLDRRAPLKAARTTLRWVALPAADPSEVGGQFAIERGGQRTLVVRCDPADLGVVGDFCDDVALHDWLLATLLHLVEDGRNAASDDLARIARVRPAVEHLLHLWMPRARLTDAVSQLWRGLDDRPGMTRQWRSCVDRIRDQLTLGTLAQLAGRAGPEPQGEGST
ncbi:SCO2521 family protein [Dactylosporangium sp. NPDC051541]|uniref:SCO2521 family protein n=1 Tax=Dactylosporangium sp. NPDC051541 TaxID=3363977 RepID=UPI0037B2BCD9